MSKKRNATTALSRPKCLLETIYPDKNSPLKLLVNRILLRFECEMRLSLIIRITTGNNDTRGVPTCIKRGAGRTRTQNNIKIMSSAQEQKNKKKLKLKKP